MKNDYTVNSAHSTPPLHPAPRLPLFKEFYRTSPVPRPPSFDAANKLSVCRAVAFALRFAFGISGDIFVTVWIFASKEQRDGRLAFLKCEPCPYCKHTGALNRHGFLRGYDEQNFKEKTIRALRVYCSNRGKAGGCGRTFSVWVANQVKRLFLDAQSLYRFLELAATSGNKSQAFQNLQSSMSHSATYRIWKRFLNAQSAIRTALTAFCPPPKQMLSDEAPSTAMSSAWATLEHLKKAFKQSTLNPIAAYQNATQSFFI